jgi:hypothetical protein
MNLRHAAALALVGWYLASPTVAGCIESDGANKWSLMMPPIIEPNRKTDLNAPLNQWWTAREYPSREICERARASWSSDSETRQQVLNAKCVYIDDWCLGITLGKEVTKHCSNCAYELVIEAYTCVMEFKTQAQCIVGAQEYVQNYYVKADKDGNLVVHPPITRCNENRPAK